MGLVIVSLRASFNGYDALADPVGWGLVLGGLVELRGDLPSADVLLWLAAIAALVSVAVYLPAVQARLSEDGQWGVSVPQTAFCLVLAGSLSRLLERAGAKEAHRFGLLRTAYAVLLVGPVLVYGGGVDALAVPLAVVAVLTNITLVYSTFAVSRRPYALAQDRPERTPDVPGSTDGPG